MQNKTTLLLGDCLEQLKSLSDNSVDSVVTDPPYGLSFMGKKWDYDVPSVEIWKEALRVLKPGGHLLSFAGTRTYHRMACNIEDAGFEIRDQIMWLYGSGFPKSHDVSKAIDKAAGAEREVVGKKPYTNQDTRGNPISETGGRGTGLGQDKPRLALDITAPATEAAKQWQGWGTALKPANEPIVVARKPLEAGLTVAANVLKYGVGALNIDASRIGTEVRHNSAASTTRVQTMGRPNGVGSGWNEGFEGTTVTGRWPANVLLDEEAAQALDEQSGILKTGGNKKSDSGDVSAFGGGLPSSQAQFTGSSGGASRFFYVAKASKRERGEGNAHPTVKPIKLMEYLIKLVTPVNGTVLDPFMGSGTTGLACVNLDRPFIGCEREEEYLSIAKARIEGRKDE